MGLFDVIQKGNLKLLEAAGSKVNEAKE